MIYKAKIPEKDLWVAEIDFEKDCEEIAKSKIVNNGFSSTANRNAPIEMFKMMKKTIKPMPRQVKKSDSFVCPSGYELALSELETKIINGENLKPFLTEKYDDVTYNDGILNDWNLFHLHLSRRYRTDGRVQRSNHLIIAWVTDDFVYFITVKDHNDIYCFTDKDYLEIIYRNWPNLLSSFIVNGVASKNLSNNDIKALREYNINGFVVLDNGLVLTNAGGGSMSNGNPIDSTLRSIIYRQEAAKWEKFLVDNIPNIIIAFQNLFMVQPKLEMKFQLISFGSDGFVCCEKTNNFIVKKTKKSFILSKD